MRNTVLCVLMMIVLFGSSSYSAEDLTPTENASHAAATADFPAEGFTLPEGYDPQNTMLALNMAVVSVHRILATQSRAVLDDEYQNIINNLSLGNIRSDPEITALYEKLLDITSRKKLRTDESARLRKAYADQAKRSISGALSDLGKSSAAMIREDGSIGAFFGSFSSLVSVSAASYFKYQTGGVNLKGSLEENLYRLSTEDLSDFNELQKQLLTSSWNLMNRYKLPDEYRLVQRSIDDFSRAVEDTPDSSRRLRMFQAMEADFRVYPPYWYYRAKSAYDCKDSDEAEKCFDMFEEVYRPVLRKDPYMLETAKYRLNEIVRENLPADEETRQTMLELCRVMRENTLRDDWVNNIFAGAVYYALGEKTTGIMCAEINIDFGYEQELSGEILRLMRANIPAGLLLSEALRSLKLNELTADMTSRDKFTALMFADCLDERDGAAERLRVARRTPAAMHMLRLEAFRQGDFPEMLALAEISGEKLSHDYAVMIPLLKTYSDDKNAIAQTFLADMYLYGWGVSEDVGAAMSLYREAAETGERYAQFMYMNLLTTSRNRPSEETIPEETVSIDDKPAKKKKPLLRFWPFKR